MGSPKMRPFFSLARKKHDRVPKDASKTNFDVPELEEIIPNLTSDAVS
jgi:hypothetical protein